MSMTASERWFRLLLRLYPPDFREELGESVVEAYCDRARDARRRGRGALAALWLRALTDAMWNGPAERARPAASWRRSGNWGRDMELAWRRLIRAPIFSVTVILTLMVGLGAFAVVYTVVQKVLIAPLPYDRPNDLYYVWRNYTWFDLDRGWLGGTDVAELQKTGGPIQDAAAMTRMQATLSGVDGLDPMEVPILNTTPNLFPLLGARPTLGRVFTESEGGPDAPWQIVLTHDLWRRLGSDASILGQEIRLNDQPYTVIGVMPEDFHFVRHASLGPPQEVAGFAALRVVLAETNPGSGSYSGLVRVRPGTTPETLRDVVTAVGGRVNERDFESRGLELYPVAMTEDLISGIRPALIVLVFAGSFLVLVLLVNLATLLLTRAAQREQEYAVSRALGANQIALVRATLLEGGMLGALGGAAAAAAAIWGTRALIAIAPMDLPRRASIAVDWQIGLTVVAIGTAVGLLAAALPALWATRTQMASLLRSAAVRGGGGHSRMRRGMVVVQVALSLVLLSAGGLVVRSFQGLLRTYAGFDTEDVITLRVPVSRQIYVEDADVNALHDRIQTALAAVPGVTGAGAISSLPLSAGSNQTSIGIPGAPGNTGDPDHDLPLIDYMSARPGYFEALRIPLLEGRTFRPALADGPREVIVDRRLAEHFFPGSSAVGGRIPFMNDTLTIVGVVEHARLYDVHEDGRPQVYLRNDQVTFSSLNFVLRTERPLPQMTAEIRRVLNDIDPRLAMSDVQSMEHVFQNALREQRLSAVLIGGFSLGALLLAAMGLFGVVAGAVTRRRHEMAVRLALGADHGRVLRMVLGEGASLVLIGIVVGVPGIFAGARLLRSVLVGVSPFDPATLTAVAAALAGVALVACYLPARRVLRIEPARSLRQE